MTFKNIFFCQPLNNNNEKYRMCNNSKWKNKKNTESLISNSVPMRYRMFKDN